MFPGNPLLSSAWQRIPIKNQVLFSLKDKSKKLKCRLLQFLFGALRVKVCPSSDCPYPGVKVTCFGKNVNRVSTQRTEYNSLTFP